MQNGAVTQKDTLNDDEFEPYLNTQARQVSIYLKAFAHMYQFSVESLKYSCLVFILGSS